VACGRFFAEILSGLLLYVGYILAGFDEEKRSLHDRIFNARVVGRRAGAKVSYPAQNAGAIFPRTCPTRGYFVIARPACNRSESLPSPPCTGGPQPRRPCPPLKATTRAVSTIRRSRP